MKKLTFLILLALMVSFAAGGMRNTIKQRPTSYWWHTGKDYTTDPARQWAYEVQDRLEGPYGTGKAWYVDSAASGQVNAESWTDAETSLDDVFTFIANDGGAARGDTIYLAQNTTLAAGVTLTLDVPGINIIGIGEGDDTPEITFDVVSDMITISASNCMIHNVRFRPSTPTVLASVDITGTADNTIISHCVWPEPATKTASLTSCIVSPIWLDDGADGVRILNNEFYSMEATGTSYFVNAGNGTNNDLVVANNDIMGEFAVAAIYSDVAASRTLISNNTIANLTSGQHCIEFTNPTTGMCVGNWMYGDTRGAVLDPGSMYCVENYATYIIDHSAELVPSALGQEHFIVGNWDYDTDGHIPLTTTLGSTIFSVTGDIQGYCYAVCAASLTAQIGSANEVQLGTIASPTMILHTISPSQELTTGDIWTGSSLATQTASFNPNTDNYFMIYDGLDIILTCNSLTANTGGTLDFYLIWIGMSTDSMVTAR